MSEGTTLREASDINKSLFTLRKALEHLATKKHNRSVFQEETLTKMLASSLLGQVDPNPNPNPNPNPHPNPNPNPNPYPNPNPNPNPIPNLTLTLQAYSLMIATISPAASALRHTRNTLHYAGTASAIQLAAPRPPSDDLASRRPLPSNTPVDGRAAHASGVASSTAPATLVPCHTGRNHSEPPGS